MDQWTDGIIFVCVTHVIPACIALVIVAIKRKWFAK